MTLLHLLVAAARAHSGAVPIRGQYDWSNLPDLEPGGWIVWTLEPSIVIGCGLFLAVYALAAGPWRRKYGWSDVGPTTAEWRSFVASIVLVFCALQGPLHELSDQYLFSGHMIQHLLITLFFPWLLIRGIPPWMWKPVVRNARVAAFGRWLTSAPIAFVVGTGTLYMWHVPAMYEWAMANHDVHIAEHLIFMAGAVVMWWPAHSRVAEVPALTPGWRMIYLFILTIPMKALGAIITISDYILYPFYSVQPRVFGLDPLTDQRLGGLIMWVPGGLVFWFTIGFIFFNSFYKDIRRERSGTQAPVPVVA